MAVDGDGQIQQQQQQQQGRNADQLRLFEAISATTPDFIYVFDRDGRFRYANRRLLEVWGRTFDEAVGKSLYELGYPQWHADMHMREIRQVLETKQPIKGEVPFTGGSGISGVYEYIFSPVLDAHGDVEVIAGTTRDVTDRRRAEERSRTILESVTDGFFALDRDWRFTYANPQAERMLDRTPGDLIGKVLWDEYPGLAGSDFERMYRTAAAGGKPGAIVAFYPDHERWYDVHAYPAPGDAGISVYFRDVTELKRSEEQLRRSHDTFYHLIQNNPFGIYVVDADFKLREVSLGAQKVFASVRPLLGRDFAEVLRIIWAEPFASEAIRLFRHTLETGEPYVSPSTIEQRQDVQAVEAYDWRIERIVLPDGRPGVVCYFYDLSERKQFEAALRDSEERLRLGLEASGTGLWDWDIVSGQVKWSARVYEFHGLKPAEFDGSVDRFIQCVHPDDRERVGAAIENAVRQHAPYEIEFRVCHPNGDIRWLLTTGKVFYDEKDMPVRMLGATADITVRKQDEEARAHLAAIVESSDDAIISKSLEGVIRSWNSGAQRIFGYAADEAVNRPVLMLLPADRKEEEAGILARLRAGERFDHFESIRVTKDGREIDVSLTISPVRDAAGRVIGASKIVRDVTRQKRADRELQAAKESADAANREKDELLKSERAARAEAERASRMKDEFLATLSHELRTPLNAILGWAQILRVGKQSETDVAEGIEVIERNARAQTQIIEDLLDMSRIISGKIRLDVQRVDLASVLRAAVETIKPAADAKAIRLRTVLDSVAGPVSGDPNRLQQVFWNLLTNAVKFTPRGGQVQVLLERVNSHVEISVIDTGEGIAADFLPHVFDRFRQADAGTTRQHGGLGLGLAIVKQLVELHGGTIRAKSGGDGKGATFTVMLPLIVIHPDAEPAAVERRHPESGAVPMLDMTRAQIAGLKVLVIDDEPDARTLVRRLLEDCKAIVTTAASAEEGMKRFRAERPGVIVSDIGMPGEDGYSLIAKVRALPPEQGGRTPAIALTAYARAEDRMKAVMSGFDLHIVKPVEPAELITMIAALARRSGSF